MQKHSQQCKAHWYQLQSGVEIKNAEAKYRSIMEEKGRDIYSQIEAKDELDKAKKDIEHTCLNKEELNDLRSGFEAAAEKIEEAIWRILE